MQLCNNDNYYINDHSLVSLRIYEVKVENEAQAKQQEVLKAQTKDVKFYSSFIIFYNIQFINYIINERIISE